MEYCKECRPYPCNYTTDIIILLFLSYPHSHSCSLYLPRVTVIYQGNLNGRINQQSLGLGMEPVFQVQDDLNQSLVSGSGLDPLFNLFLSLIIVCRI